jgi:hypothetical protein
MKFSCLLMKPTVYIFVKSFSKLSFNKYRLDLKWPSLNYNESTDIDLDLLLYSSIFKLCCKSTDIDLDLLLYSSIFKLSQNFKNVQKVDTCTM